MKTSHYLFAIVFSLFAVAQLTSCNDDPDTEFMYVMKSQYASDYLKESPRFSKFTQIVTRSKMMDLLGTYGSYTVFAPTDDAVDKFLQGRGLSSVDELSQADCDTITFTHIIEHAYFTTDYNDGTYPVMNMLDRPLTISCDSDTLSVPGEIHLAIYINKQSRMIHEDDSVANGVVHTMDQVIGTNNFMLTDIMKTDESIKLFTSALLLTHMSDSLTKYKDENYSVGKDSIDWTNDRLIVHTGNEYDNVAYMENRYFKFTAFVPLDAMLEEKYGVTDIDGLIQLAKECYDPVYPEDADITDPTDRRNSLNRFVSYHLLPFQASYYRLTAVDGPNSVLASSLFYRKMWDISCWYETLMPHSILKVSFPSGTESGLYVNRRGIQSRADQRNIKIRGSKVLTASESHMDQTSLNGVYHYIDDILSYGYHPGLKVNTQYDVMNERIRVDCAALSPDFITSGGRGHNTQVNTNINPGLYGQQSFSTQAATNPNTCLGYKAGSAANFYFTDATHIHIRPRYLPFASYEGDEVTVKGRYDLTVKLPPVPEGDWEVRFFTCVGLPSRGIVQFYIDNVPQGIPFDMRPSGRSAHIGYKSDEELGDALAISTFDKQFRYRGWMKGPSSSGFSTNNTSITQVFRQYPENLRKIIGVFHSDGKTDHYLRMQQKMESENNECSFDMIEIVPSNVYNNPDVLEDRL